MKAYCIKERDNNEKYMNQHMNNTRSFINYEN